MTATLRSAALEVDLLPEVGGKIGQIRDRGSGYSFLVAPQKPYRPLQPGERWIDGDTSGMDDCFPNIEEGPYPAEPWTHVRLPQLGEWVYGGWKVLAAGESEVSLTRRGTDLPYEAWKTVRLVGDRTIELLHRVENRGDAPLRYMWAAHPLIAVGEEFELKLPAGDLRFHRFPHDEQRYRWPWYRSIDLSRQWVGRGTTLKVFVTGLPEGWAELRFGGRRLHFSFRLASTPVVGIWYNNFGFPAGGRPFRCIAVEPCTSPSDLLDALEPGTYPAIPPGDGAEWWTTVRIE